MEETKLDITQKYLKVDKLVDKLKVKSTDVELLSNDTINEAAMLNTLINLHNTDEIYCAVIQMAIIGYGQKQFNQYMYKGEVKELRSLFKKCGIKSDLTIQTKLDPKDLTPRRLIRLFRYHIKRYLEENQECASYLFLKYTDCNAKYRVTCFPGAEHLVEDEDEVQYLIKAYYKLDESLKERGLQNNISLRIKRVLLARGKMKTSEILN
jgi:hypothetical protein